MQNFTELLMMNQRAGNNKDLSHQVFITNDNAPRTIYVADLPKSITYLELSEFMEKNIGTCVITIKRPMFKDFYYAFVQFQKLDDARKASQEFKYPTLCGVKCRILAFNDQKFKQAPNQHPYGGQKPAPKNTQLFVKGLPKQWTHEDLSNAFEKFGKILSAKVSIDGEHNSRCYGFVQLDSEKASQQAIQKMNDHIVEATDEVDEAKLTVCEFVPRLDRVGTTKPRCSTNLYVKNFPTDEFAEDDLRSLFEPFGEVVSTAIMRDSDQKSKKFGFVCFKQSDDSQKALEHFQFAPADDKENSIPVETDTDKQRRLYVCEFKSKKQRQLELEKSTYHFKKSQHLLNLIVRNVDPATTKDEFLTFFTNFGEIKSCKVVHEAQTGFVCFQEREAARLAKEQPDLVFRGRKLQVDFCEPKESRQKRQEEQWDRHQFHRQKASQLQSNNQDVIQLITSLSLLMGQLQQKGGSNNAMKYNNNNGMNNFNSGGNQGQQARMANGNNGYQHHFRNRQQNSFGGQQVMNSAPGPQGQMGGNQVQPQQMSSNNGGGNQNYHRQQYGGPQMGQNPMPMPTPNVRNGPNQPQMHIDPNQQSQGTPNNESTRYRNEIMQIFMGEKFMQANETQKKQIIGTHIFRFVTNLVGQEYSPKITGMIIDLPIADLNYSVSTLETLNQKVKSAVQLLIETNNLPDDAAKSLPMNAFPNATPNNVVAPGPGMMTPGALQVPAQPVQQQQLQAF